MWVTQGQIHANCYSYCPRTSCRFTSFSHDLTRTPNRVITRSALSYNSNTRLRRKSGKKIKDGEFPIKFSWPSTGFVMFSDVAGAYEAKEELQDIIEFLKHPKKYIRLGASLPRGVLLVGPSGTGKTLLAKAVIGEAQVPFIICSSSEFERMGASRLFARARKKAPSIIFIDRVDDLGKQSLNEMFNEMRGSLSSSDVIVLAATDREEKLDQKHWELRRFDRVIMVERPDNVGRHAILNLYISKKGTPLGHEVDLADIARITIGFSGAELDNVVNEAALLAGRQNKKAVENIDFINAVERSTIGIEKKFSRLEGGQKAMVARHEVGHAIANAAVSKILSGKLVVELSVVPRFGGVLGFTSVSKYLNCANELRGQLVTLLGGIAAEKVLYSGQVSIGSWDDIERATELTYDIVAEHGFNRAVGPISITELSRVGGRSMERGHLGDLVQREIKSMLQSAQDVAVCVIRANLTVLNGLGACLEEKEKLEGDELQERLNLVIA